MALSTAARASSAVGSGCGSADTVATLTGVAVAVVDVVVEDVAVVVVDAAVVVVVAAGVVAGTLGCCVMVSAFAGSCSTCVSVEPLAARDSD